MPITFECQDCGARYKTKEENIGRKTRCKNCEAVVIIQDAGEKKPRQNRPKTQVITKTDLRPKTKSIPTDRPKTRSTKVTKSVTRSGSKVSKRPSSKVASAPESRSGTKTSTRPVTKTIKRPESRAGSKVMPKEKAKPKMSPIARAKARHKTIDKSSLSKLSKATGDKKRPVDRSKMKEASSHHESHLDKLKADKGSKTKTIIMIIVAVLFLGGGGYAVFVGTAPNDDMEKAIKDKSKEIAEIAIDGGEWWCNGWYDAEPGQWVKYNKGFTKKNADTSTTATWKINSRDEDEFLVRYDYTTTVTIEEDPTEDPTVEEQTDELEASFDPVRAKSIFLATTSAKAFQVTKIEENVSITVNGKTYDNCVKIVKVKGTNIHEIKQIDRVWYSKSVPGGHVVKHESRDPSMDNSKWRNVLALIETGGPDVVESNLSRPSATIRSGDEDAGDDSSDGGDDTE